MFSVCAKQDSFFSVSYESGLLSIEKMPIERNISSATKAKILESGTVLLKGTLDYLRKKNIRKLAHEERDEIASRVDFAASYIKKLKRNFGKTHPQEIENLELMLLSAKIGGKIDPETLKKNPDFIRFLTVNHLQHKIQALGRESWVIPTIGIEGHGDYVFWSSLQKTPKCDADGKQVGYQFFLKEQVVFETDLSLRLLSGYSYIDGKIAKYHSIFSPELRHYDTQPKDGTFKVEVWTALRDAQGQRPALRLGEHSYMVLVDDEGKRFGVGQYGVADDLGISGVVTGCGYKRGSIEAPDRYLMLPRSSYNMKKTVISISKDQFDRMKARLQQDKKEQNIPVSLLKSNCTSYVREIMEVGGIALKTKVHLVNLLFLRLAPLFLVRAVETWKEKIFSVLPTWIQKGVYFNPFHYLLGVGIGIGARLLSCKNFQQKNPDISWGDIFFRPWKIEMDHPFALRQWQEAYIEKTGEQS